jgi:hypothetical protein
MQLLRSTEDLHCTEYGAKNVTTEYEDKFKAQGIKINYCMVMVSAHIQQNPDIQTFHSGLITNNHSGDNLRLDGDAPKAARDARIIG